MIYLSFCESPKKDSQNALKQLLGADFYQIKKTASGKPYLPDSNIHFNLTHTEGAFAIFLSDRPCGIDMEKIRPFHPKIPPRFFSPLEAAYVKDDPKRFFEVWTKKEAIIKALGMGLTNLTSIPENSFKVFTEEYGNYIISYAVENPEKEQFVLL